MSGIVRLLNFVKPPRAIRLLAEHGAAALRPRIDKGRYIAPLVPKRVAANIRKRAVIEGTFGTFSETWGGWDPAWDEARKVYGMRAHKGHERDRSRKERAEKISKAMEGMPEKINKYKQEASEKKSKKDLIYQLKRVAELNKTRP